MHENMLLWTGDFVAKPIRATPTLIGKDAMAFLAKMKKTDKARLSKADEKLLVIIRESQPVFALAKSRTLNQRA